MAGTESRGPVISMSDAHLRPYAAAHDKAQPLSGGNLDCGVGKHMGRTKQCGCEDGTLEARAFEGFNEILRRLATLYCHGESSSLSEFEAFQVMRSMRYVLGISDAVSPEALCGLASNPQRFYEQKLAELEHRKATLMRMWQEVCATMLPIRNVSLRDTLASIGDVPVHYDMRFAAHEVPCDIQYQLSAPVDDSLEGLDYLEAWLAQLKWETAWIARFTPESCKAVLEEVCPDYRGLHVNLFDLLNPCESRLVRA